MSSSSFYNTIAPYYESYCKDSGINDFLNEEIFVVEFYNPSSVVELGIGNGRFAREYLKRNPCVIYTGVDNSEAMLSFSKDIKATLILSDFEIYIKKLQEEKSRVDLIVAPYTSFHHIKTEDQYDIFFAMKDVAKTIILNCLTKKEESLICGENSKGEVLFPVHKNKHEEVTVYTINDLIRSETESIRSGKTREYLIYTSENYPIQK